jgi:hypothetical protein
LLLIAIAWVVMWHPIDLYLLTLVVIFFVIAQWDTVYVLFRGDARYTRAFVFFVITLILTVGAATGALNAITHNLNITYTFWIEVGTAAAAFFLFRPLTQLAMRAAVDTIAEEGARQAANYVLLGETSRLLLAPAKVVDADPATHHGNGDDDADDEDLNDRFGRAQQMQAQALEQALKVAKALNPWVWTSLLIFVLIYHNLAASSDLLAVLGDNFTTIFLAGVTAFLALLALFVGRTFEAARDVLLVIGVIIAITAVSDVFLNSYPDAAGTISQMPGALDVLWKDPHFLFATAHSIVQELLVLLALGQAYYLLVVLRARFTDYEEKARRSRRGR